MSTREVTQATMARVKAAFPEPQRPRAVELLRSWTASPSAEGLGSLLLERVHFAALVASRGSLRGLEDARKLASTDWRDLLVGERERAAAHPEGRRIEFRRGSASELPVDSTSVDLVLAFDSFDHWPQPELGLAEVRRVLRAGGRFVVVKDGGVPGADPARQRFLALVDAAGFEIEREVARAGEGVTLALWSCRPRDAR